MNMTRRSFDEAKSWSLLSPQPVLVGDVCFWCGLLMHKNTALAVASQIFMHIPITPNQKHALWDQTFDMLAKAKRDFGYIAEFNISEYAPEELYRYVVRTLHEHLVDTGNIAGIWITDKFNIIEFFLMDQ
jgi:hypothetical protein